MHLDDYIEQAQQGLIEGTELMIQLLNGTVLIPLKELPDGVLQPVNFVHNDGTSYMMIFTKPESFERTSETLDMFDAVLYPQQGMNVFVQTPDGAGVMINPGDSQHGFVIYPNVVKDWKDWVLSQTVPVVE